MCDVSKNNLKSKLDSGSTLLGAQAKTNSPILVEVYGQMGFDFVWVDFEHVGRSPDDMSILTSLSRASRISNIEIIARVPAKPPTSLIRKMMDAGIQNILIPRVEGPGEVEKIIRASRFVYKGEPGERGVGGGWSNRWTYPDFGDPSHAHKADESSCIGIMIENINAVQNIDEILQLPHIGFVFIGPADLSISIGAPLMLDNESVRNSIETVRRACNKNEIPIGRVANNVSDARSLAESGYQILRIGGEITAVRNELGDKLDDLKCNL